MTGVDVSWSAPGWVGLSDEDYSDLIRKKAVAVTRRDKRRDGKYSVKEAIEAIHQAFHRCNGFDPYDGSMLDPELALLLQALKENYIHRQQFLLRE